MEIREDSIPYVRFERVAVEDRQESLRAGQYMVKDVDYALITPQGSTDILKYKVTSWFAQMESDARSSPPRLPMDWLLRYKKAYEHWLLGQEIPLEGTSIKGWGMISPAQKENLLGINIRTVEDLANCNDEAIRRIGMGGVDLRNRAVGWLKSLNSSGNISQIFAEIQRENEELRKSIETLTAKLAELSKRGKKPRPSVDDTNDNLIPYDFTGTGQ